MSGHFSTVPTSALASSLGALLLPAFWALCLLGPAALTAFGASALGVEPGTASMFVALSLAATFLTYRHAMRHPGLWLGVWQRRRDLLRFQNTDRKPTIRRLLPVWEVRARVDACGSGGSQAAVMASLTRSTIFRLVRPASWRARYRPVASGGVARVVPLAALL